MPTSKRARGAGDRCEVPRCRGQCEIVYLGHALCDRCWNRYQSEEAGEAGNARLRKLLGLPPMEPARA